MAAPVLYSKSATLVGALLGAVAGFALAHSDRKGRVYTLGATAVSAAVGAAIGRGLSAQPNPAYVAQGPSGGQPLALDVSALTGAITITVAPGTVAQALEVNTAVLLYLPAGGKWVSRDGAGISDPVSPQAFVFAGPISHTFVWTDSSGATQTTDVNLVVAPPAGVVTT